MKKFQNVLVAFDLNKTLFYKSDKPVHNLKHDKKIKGLYFYFRPYLKQLIQFLHTYKLNYCFWSNMMGRNCLKYVKLLEQLGMNKHCGIFDQQFCDKIQGADQINIKSIKNLNKLAHQYQIDVDCCILVDDSKQKNVKGCHMIQVLQYSGNSLDKQMLRVIEQLKIFRKSRVSQKIQDLLMLQMTKYTFPLQQQQVIYKHNKLQQKKIIEKMQKLTISQQQSQVEKLIAQTPHLKKMKEQLNILKLEKKQISKQIESNQEKSKAIDQKIKKFGQVKVIRKGDSALMELLILAKQKKILQKQTNQCKMRKQKCVNKLKQIKDQMHKQVQKLVPRHQKKQQHIQKKIQYNNNDKNQEKTKILIENQIKDKQSEK